MLESRLRGQPKERDIQAQGLAHCSLVGSDRRRCKMRDAPNSGEASTLFLTETNTLSLTQPSAVPGTSALMVLCAHWGPNLWAGLEIR